MLTRKHFETAARKVRGMHNRYDAKTVALFLSAWFLAENPRFDVRRFLDACGPLPSVSRVDAVGRIVGALDGLALDDEADRAVLLSSLSPVLHPLGV